MSDTKRKAKKKAVDVGAEGSDKGKGQQKRSLNLHNGLIVATRLVKEYKRLIFLDKEIQRKKEKEDKDKNYKSERLEPYKEELDELVKQVHKDIPELQLTIDGECDNTFRRDDIRRATSGDIDKRTRPHHSAKEQDSNQRQESSTEQKEKDIAKEEGERYKENWRKAEDAKIQLEKSIRELNRTIEEYKNEKVALHLNHKEELGVHKEENVKLKERLEEEKRKSEYEIQRLEKSYKDCEHEVQTLSDQCKRLEEEKRKAEYELQRCTENWSKAEDAKIQLEMNIKELKRKIEEYENEKVALHLNHKEELGAHKAENRKLKERLEEEKKKSEHEIQRLEAKTNQLTGQLDAERKAKEDALIRLEEEKRKTEYEFQRLEARTNQVTGQLDAERKAKEDALIRLSSMASNKLRDNNPNIADLSDPYRPTKLSEQFSELYDNEWTDAFDELEKELNIELKEEETMETKIISYLRDILLKIHSMCNDTSSKRLKGIEEAFVKPFDDTTVPTEVFKMIKDALKSMAPYCLEGIRKVVLIHLEMMYFGNPVAVCLQRQNVKRYIDKCTDICWYMSVQDPQVFMDGNKSPNGNFDSNKHREYTKKGPYEEYVVWPVLYLYKDGQMLSKGVAQGKKMENKKEMTEH